VEGWGGQRMSHLIQLIKKKPNAFSVFQLKNIADFLNYKIIFKPNESLGFPAADIHQIQVDENKKTFTVIVNFMGLYGVDSPLPTFILQKAAEQSERGKKLRIFLDIFHKRMYSLLLENYKNKNIFHISAGKKDKAMLYQQYIAKYRLANVNVNAKANAYASILGKKIISAYTLKNIILKILPISQVVIHQLIPSWLPIASQGFVLGVDTIVGARALSATKKIIIELGNITWDLFLSLLPGSEKANQLQKLLAVTLSQDMNYDYQFSMQSRPQGFILGKEPILLGWGAAVGKLHNNTYIITISKNHYLNFANKYN